MVFFVLSTWSGPLAAARACADRLTSRQGRPDVVTRLDFDRSGVRAVTAFGFRPGELARTVVKQALTISPHADGGVYGILYRANPGQMDKGFVLRGERIDDTLIVHSFYESSVDDDVRYFERVAEIHGFHAQTLKLERAILECRSLALSAAAQAKLWLKHRLRVGEVVEFLNTARRRPEYHRTHKNGRPRYAIEGQDRRGRRVRVVVQFEGHCPNGLITAYQMR